jgi:hypothetical protein
MPLQISSHQSLQAPISVASPRRRVAQFILPRTESREAFEGKLCPEQHRLRGPGACIRLGALFTEDGAAQL